MGHAHTLSHAFWFAGIAAVRRSRCRLDAARKKFHPDEPIEFQQADAMALRFADPSFDAGSASSALSSSRTRRNPTARRIACWRPGGRHVFSVWDGGYNRHPRIADEVAAEFFPTDPPQFYGVGMGYSKIDPIKDSLSDAGFLGLRIAVLAMEKQVTDIGVFARALVYGNPLIGMIRTRAGVEKGVPQGGVGIGSWKAPGLAGFTDAPRPSNSVGRPERRSGGDRLRHGDGPTVTARPDGASAPAQCRRANDGHAIAATTTQISCGAAQHARAKPRLRSPSLIAGARFVPSSF